MTPTAAVRSILGDYVSEARCREVVVAVLRACREPTPSQENAGDSLDAATDDRAPAVWHYRAMIDALIEEVTADAP